MLYLHALRVARARQLRARALRPLARRRFPGGEPPGEASPIPLARELWASPAFEASSPLDASTRLGRFHRQYGDDVLAAARAGDLEEARRLVATWIEAHPPHDGDAWHPVSALDARRQLDRRAHAACPSSPRRSCRGACGGSCSGCA